MSEYVPVPVEAAREIAQKFAKDIVVIVATDRAHDQIHTTTYGRSQFDKIHAAELGPVLATAAGGFVPAAKMFEDFRDPAERAVKYDALLARHDAAIGYLRGLLQQCPNLGADAREAVEEFLESEVPA